jgi:outer membrane protein assembly factor BamB
LWRQPLPDADDAPWRGGATQPGFVTAELFIIASLNARLYGFDRHSGELRWTYLSHMPLSAGVAVIDSVAVVANNRIEGVSIGLGQRLWSRHVGSTVDYPLSAAPGLVLASVGRLYALDAEGKERWGHGGAAWNEPVYSTPATLHAGTIYIGSFEGFHALPLPDDLH